MSRFISLSWGVFLFLPIGRLNNPDALKTKTDWGKGGQVFQKLPKCLVLEMGSWCVCVCLFVFVCLSTSLPVPNGYTQDTLSFGELV